MPRGLWLSVAKYGLQNIRKRSLLYGSNELAWGRGSRGSNKQHADPPQCVGSYMLLDYNEPDQEVDPAGITVINSRHKTKQQDLGRLQTDNKVFLNVNCNLVQIFHNTPRSISRL